MNGAAHAAHTPRILVADADADIRALYREPLAREGCDVVEATDGRDALAKAFVRELSLLITELHLPLINGFALCRILRQDRMTANVPILVVTSETRSQQVMLAFDSGADVVLAKPADLGAILQESRRLMIQSHQLGQQLAAVRDKVREQLDISAQLLGRGHDARRPMSKSHNRFETAAPPSHPPSLMCPRCDRPLTYEKSYIGGVSERHPEQWDEFTCAECGKFEYRHRTRMLRRVP